MDNIKFLQIRSLYFRLPDDFDGTTQDGFKLLSEYINKCTISPSENCGKDVETIDIECWKTFVELYPHEENKVIGSFGLTELKDGKYILFD